MSYINIKFYDKINILNNNYRQIEKVPDSFEKTMSFIGTFKNCKKYHHTSNKAAFLQPSPCKVAQLQPY